MLLNLLTDYGYTVFRENPSSYTLRLSLPGVGKDNIKISLEDTRLIIKVYTTSLTYPLPTNASKEKIEAKYEDGILRVTVEKDKSKTRDITIG